MAVHDHRALTVERASRFRIELLQWDVDRARKTIVLVLRFGQHVDELGSFVEEPLDVVTVNSGGRRTSLEANAQNSNERRAAFVSTTEVPLDVESEIEIAQPRGAVADYASNPDNATAWYENIESVEWKSPKPLAVGSRIAFVARFLGRRIAYTYEVKELVPGERFVMSTAEGPFPMETTYAWKDAADGGTTMTLRNRGELAGFSRFLSPLLAPAVRRANRKDLARLKTILEASGY